MNWQMLVAAGLLMGCSAQAEDRAAKARATLKLDMKKPKVVLLRGFKHERELEVWAGEDPTGPLTLLWTAPVAAASGVPGPKRKVGDKQVPEGFYIVDRLNPKSAYHLSLGIDYPNASDRVRSDPKTPGSDIFIHGDRKSIGCLAMTDEGIEPIYALAEKVRRAGGKVHVHLFPFRMTPANLARIGREYPQHRAFWSELEPGFAAFERTRRVPTISVRQDGSYRVAD